MTHTSDFAAPGRRGFLGLLAGGCVLAAAPARALDASQAVALIRRTVADVYAIIESGRPAAQMYADFAGVFGRYADVDAIARSALGPAARSASPQQFAAFRQAMQGYIGRKYGKRFNEFVGGRVDVGAARPVKSFFAVDSTAYLNGQSPMKVEWHVSDKSGSPRFFNLIIEGVNMLASEREEIGAMLARRQGDPAGLTADLQRAG